VTTVKLLIVVFWVEERGDTLVGACKGSRALRPGFSRARLNAISFLYYIHSTYKSRSRCAVPVLATLVCDGWSVCPARLTE
jgi:hypothetical protein